MPNCVNPDAGAKLAWILLAVMTAVVLVGLAIVLIAG